VLRNPRVNGLPVANFVIFRRIFTQASLTSDKFMPMCRRTGV